MSWMKRHRTPLLGLMAVLFLLLPVRAYGATESHLPLDLREHWSAPYVITMLERSIVSGCPDGRYYPERQLTREEAVSLLYKLAMDTYGHIPQPRQGPAPYLDIDGRWSYSMITTLWQGGILEDSAAFRPMEAVTREDMARYTALCLTKLEEAAQRAQEEAGDDSAAIEDEATAAIGSEVPPSAQTEQEAPVPPSLGTGEPAALEPTPDAAPFSDIAGSPNYDYMMYLHQRNILSGYSDGLFHPQAPLTRAEAATMLYRASGYPLSSTDFPPLPSSRVIAVPYISQVYPVYAPVGCEAVSLLMGLQGKGYALDVPVGRFLDEMPKTTSNPAKGFVGSPYVPDPSKKTRTTIYPPVLAEFGQRYGRVIDLSGASTQELQRELLSGNPVVVYVTLWWEPPFYRPYLIEGEQQHLLSNNHAVLACGYNAETHQYYIADPYNIKSKQEEYFYWISGDIFDPLYLERRHALSVS